ncbi:hypothetical protein LJC71_05895 [Desulfosarcina sp. OttesenSCG-928-A07]|nr:hypothetical protein [Desulfosarcina sp. OttesenSCG-928-A07]
MAHRFEQLYQSKRISPVDAAGMVTSGMTVHLGGNANLATIIDKYLAQRKDELENVAVRTYLDTYPLKVCETDPHGDVFNWSSGFILGFTRPFSKSRGIGIYRPNTWHNAPSFIRSSLSLDIFFLVTAPMDEAGYFNFGLTVTETMAICEVAKKIVVIVRKDMPTIFGGNEEALHISNVDYVVEDDEFETFCLPAAHATEADQKIALNVMDSGLLTDGATLQIGIGGLPNSVLDLLRPAGIKNCGFHTEMLTEKMLDLIEAGIVTNTEKKLDRFKTVFTFCLGSRKLYDFADRNPAFAAYPVNYTNHPLVIAQQPRMFSLNSATMIDLTGQIASEQIPGDRPYQVSGTGGQLDFSMGTMFSHDEKGVSIIAVYSERNGESKIVPLLEKGASVTVPRSMVDCVATEWGIARLRGLAVNERARALIAIAHPAYREELTRSARDAGLIPYGMGPGGKPPKGVLTLRE